MCNIYLVDDDQDVLDSLSWMLDGLNLSTQGFLNADAFLALVDIKQAGIAILDIQMPGMDGIALLNHLKSRHSPFSIIMLTGHGTISMAVNTIQQGAMDFLEKPVDGDKLQLLLEKAKKLTLENYHNQCFLDSIEDKMNHLTSREKQVMSMVLEGKLNKVIASELNIGQRTIELHRQKVMQKMNVSNVAELAYLIAKSKE
ncbi:Two component transcriptional regulator, LuxR family [Shewanella benthica]|uniref:Two component transcriptional regulator, LuxR family n=1 Tax=Shewanella benthica TaxID=43661 RepID=A0A330M6X0_9GAMM|nr:response regulator [Shewanella benthica]SQH76730.1 Two component transcriptional regulator, LuxR family [Shewanella benthica]